MSIFKIWSKIPSAMNPSLSLIKERIKRELSLVSSKNEFFDDFISYIKHELKLISSSKESSFLNELSSKETSSLEISFLDKNNFTKKDYLLLENDILGLLDLFFEIDLERKEFDTSRQLAILKAKFLSPFIETNKKLLLEFGFIKEKEAVTTKDDGHPAYNYFYNLKR